MSSYQFMNSLTSCYQQGQATRPGGSPLDTSSPTSEYYAQNAGVVPAYGTAGCYSPAQQYANQYMQQSPGGMMDYTQLHTAQQHQRIHLQQLHQHHPSLASPGAMSPILNNNNNTTVTSLGSGSCKYEVNSPNVATTNGIGSPQDLTTSAQPNRTPPLSTAVVKAPPRTPAAGASPSAAQNTGPASQSSSSPASSESSSPGGNNSSAGGKSSSGNPPQIYPWMKRVHLGQSEYLHLHTR